MILHIRGVQAGFRVPNPHISARSCCKHLFPHSASAFIPQQSLALLLSKQIENPGSFIKALCGLHVRGNNPQSDAASKPGAFRWCDLKVAAEGLIKDVPGRWQAALINTMSWCGGSWWIVQKCYGCRRSGFAAYSFWTYVAGFDDSSAYTFVFFWSILRFRQFPTFPNCGHFCTVVETFGLSKFCPGGFGATSKGSESEQGYSRHFKVWSIKLWCSTSLWEDNAAVCWQFQDVKVTLHGCLPSYKGTASSWSMHMHFIPILCCELFSQWWSWLAGQDDSINRLELLAQSLNKDSKQNLKELHSTLP